MGGVTAPVWIIMVLSVSTDFVIAGGGTLLGAIIEGGAKQMPSNVALLVACLTGALAAAKELRSMLHLQIPPPPIAEAPKP